MNEGILRSNSWCIRDVATLLARFVLGIIFVYMGVNKALHPVEFLKLVRQYDAIQSYFWLNLIASALPWFEIFCGVLLVLGIAVRGTSLMLFAMLVLFSGLVLARALAIHASGALPFCAIKFDCGCGAGEVLICRKLAENLLLTCCSLALVFVRSGRGCLRHALVKNLT